MSTIPEHPPAPEPTTVEVESDQAANVKFDLQQAREALAKLPILGPALWLYGRDPLRKFSFIADVDWLLLPPLVLDQCRLYMRSGIPFSFYAWAFVNDVVDARLRSGVAKVAPHEWKSGSHLWLTDMVSPFGTGDETLTKLLQGPLAGHVARALLPDPSQGGRLTVRTWPAHNSSEPGPQ